MPDLHRATFLPSFLLLSKVKVLGSEWDFCGSERGIMGWNWIGWDGYRAGVPVAYSTCPVWHRLLSMSTPGRVDAYDRMRWVAG